MFKKIRELKYIWELGKALKLNPWVQGIAYGRIRNQACLDVMNGKISDGFYKEFFTIPLDKLKELVYN